MTYRSYGKNSSEICNRPFSKCYRVGEEIYRRYGKIANVCRQINYDIKHDIKQGATNDQVLLFLQKIRNDSSFSILRAIDGSLDRLEELENEFLPDKKIFDWY
jgi:hypothetical protein